MTGIDKDLWPLLLELPILTMKLFRVKVLSKMLILKSFTVCLELQPKRLWQVKQEEELKKENKECKWLQPLYLLAQRLKTRNLYHSSHH